MIRLNPKDIIIERLAGGQMSPGAGTFGPRAEQIIAAPAERGYSAAVIVGVAQALEALMLIMVGLGVYLVYPGSGEEIVYVPVIVLAVLSANVLFNAARTHRIAAYRTVVMQTGRVLAAWSVVFVGMAMFAFMLKASDHVSRIWMVSWFATGAISLVTYRLALHAAVHNWTVAGRLKRRTVIVGGGDSAGALIKAIRESADSDVELLGLFDDRVDERSPDVVAGCPKLGRVADLADFARRTRVDLVIVSMPIAAERRVLDMLGHLWVLPVDIRLSAHMSKLRFAPRAYSYLGNVPVFDVADRPISDWNLIVKWLFDKTVALVSLLLLAPVMIATAIAIKLDSPGPILFRQKRYGFNNELIEVFKFRSMYANQSDARATRLVTRDDPRVTPVGRFIRRTSIDELPQLFNVLLGQLSIVGPRPHALEAKAANRLYHEAVDGYFARHRVKPGITGWAQINGWRGETDTVEKIMQRVHHDLYYIEHWSILLDIYVLFMTPFSLISKNENAY
ncbi:MAG TPA: undecaprenyl-phosphate glucose phosphotransferase [Devosiaceae bacterium]